LRLVQTKGAVAKVPATIDLTGHRYGRLTVIGPRRQENGRTLWRCRCDCGTVGWYVHGQIRNGATSSCGCLRRELAVAKVPAAAAANSRNVTCRGRTQNISKWAEELGINPKTLHHRLFRLGIPPERALQPGRLGTTIRCAGVLLTQADWCRRLGISSAGLCWRLRRWPLERALTTPPRRP
jgi:hypothetical protein